MSFFNEAHEIHRDNNVVDDLMLIGHVVWYFGHGRVVEGVPLDSGCDRGLGG